MANNIERVNTVQFQLYSPILGEITIDEPKGWETDAQGFKRDKKSRAVLLEKDVNLEFYGKAAEYISTVFRSFGISEKLLLSRYDKDVSSLSEQWTLRYVKQIDLSTFKEEVQTGKVTVKAVEGGLYTDIDNGQDDELDILTNVSNVGTELTPLKTNKLFVDQRDIFIESYLKDKASDYKVITVSYNDRDSIVARSIPLDKVYISGDDVVVPASCNESYNNLDSPSITLNTIGSDAPTALHFFEQSNTKKKIQVKARIEFKISDFYSRRIFSATFGVSLRTSELSGSTSILKDEDIKLTIDPETDRNTHVVTIDQEVDLEKGDSVSLVFFSSYINFPEPGTAKTVVSVDIKDSWLKVQNLTSYPPTQNKCITPLNLLDRLVAKITGKEGLVRSSVFEKGGKYANMVIDNGFWCRGFPNEITDDAGNVEKIQFKTSFKDAFESLNYIEPMAWFVETEGLKQVIRVEPASYTTQNFIGVDLGVVDQIEHEASDADFFSKIVLGHNGSLKYEEVNGLDEYNGKSEFSTPINESKNAYMVVSRYRVDSTGYEFIRRKQYVNFPNEDTDRDEDIWIHDCRLLDNGVFAHLKWNDSLGGNQLFSQAPKGIFSPDTAWNLRFSPMNRLLFGHGYSAKRCLYYFPEKYVRFSSSNSNQNLITYPDGIELFEGNENGKVKIRDFGKPKITPERTSFNFKITTKLENMFLGSSMINGKKVSNLFGLIRYIENGEERYGRIDKMTGDEKVKLTVMNAKL